MLSASKGLLVRPKTKTLVQHNSSGFEASALDVTACTVPTQKNLINETLLVGMIRTNNRKVLWIPKNQSNGFPRREKQISAGIRVILLIIFLQHPICTLHCIQRRFRLKVCTWKKVVKITKFG